MFNDTIPFLGRDAEEHRSPAPQEPKTNGKARIRVIGVGGAGNNAVNRMIEAGITSAEYIAVNTDAQILACNLAPTRIQIGAQKTKGLGAGADPDIGREAAEESKDELSKAIDDTDLLFITAGMGGGTGTGAAPVIAKMAKDKRILTVAVVTAPFDFEGKHRMDNALKGIDRLRKCVDTIIVIPNEKIMDVVPPSASVADAFSVADDVLKQGIRGIADLIVTPALINLDFADVRTILKDRGMAHMGVGVARGENRIVTAVKLAVNSPLLETTIVGATGVIINIVGGRDLSIGEARTAAELIHSVVDYSANIIYGVCIDENMQDEVQVTVIATGFTNGENAADEQSSVQVARAIPREQPAPKARPWQYATVEENAPAQDRPVAKDTVRPSEPVYEQPAPQPQPAPEPQPAPQEERSAEPQDEGGSKMPLFMQRLLGKKK